MPMPKKKTSKSKRDMRRSHNALDDNFPSRCETTGELHRPHRAYKTSDGAIYFKGQPIVPARD